MMSMCIDDSILRQYHITMNTVKSLWVILCDVVEVAYNTVNRIVCTLQLNDVFMCKIHE